MLLFFRVSENIPLYDILNEFQKGHSHIAVVIKNLHETKETLKKTETGEYPETKHSSKKHRAGSESILSKGEDVNSGRIFDFY